MTNVFKKSNHKLIGILLIVSAVLYIVDTLINIEDIKMWFTIDEAIGVIHLIAETVYVLFIIFLTVSFFAKKRKIMVFSYLLFIIYEICLYVKVKFIENYNEKPDKYTYIHDRRNEEFIWFYIDILVVTAFIVLFIDCCIKKNFSIPTKIAVAIIAATTLYDISDYIIFFSLYVAFYIFSKITYIVALFIAYFSTEKKPKPARDAATKGIAIKNELISLKKQYESKQISEEEYNSKRAELVKKL